VTTVVIFIDVISAFLFGTFNVPRLMGAPIDIGNDIFGAVMGVGSSIAWALSATVKEYDNAGGLP
jgi:hypothetical protein